MSSPRIDMHCHSTNSDGAQSSEGVFREAQEKKIDIFAITDHDTVTRIPGVDTGVQ